MTDTQENKELEKEETVSQEEAAKEEQAAPEKTAEEKLQEEVADLKDQLLRKIAEFDNFRKRTQKEKEAIYPQAKADTVEKFLPIIDNFERALACECADKEFKKGFEMIYSTFMETMKQCNVETVGAEGEAFDPNLHNAVMHIEDESFGENVIVEVFQKGYKIGDRVVRYAMVKVAN